MKTSDPHWHRTAGICFFKMTRETEEWEGDKSGIPTARAQKGKRWGGYIRVGARRSALLRTQVRSVSTDWDRTQGAVT